MPKPHDPDLKARVLDLRATNRSVPYIARALGVPVRTVYDWCREARALALSDLHNIQTRLDELAETLDDRRLFDLAVLLAKVARGLTA